MKRGDRVVHKDISGMLKEFPQARIVLPGGAKGTVMTEPYSERIFQEAFHASPLAVMVRFDGYPGIYICMVENLIPED